MAYSVEFTPLAARQIRKMSRDVQKRIIDRIEELQEDPRPHGVKKLTDLEALYRVGVGDYRIIYQIRDKALVVLIVKVGHRREVYRIT